VSEKPSVIDQLREILLDTLKGGDYDLEAIGRSLTPETEFSADLQMDSLDQVDYVVAVETHFGIRIPQKDYDDLRNLAAVASYIEKLS
jgi:acyl carrier protein